MIFVVLVDTPDLHVISLFIPLRRQSKNKDWMSFNISGLNKSWLFVSYLYPAVICCLWVCIMYFCVGKVCWKMISRNVDLNWCWKHQIETSRTDKIACNKRILYKKLISVKFILVHKVYSKKYKNICKTWFYTIPKIFQ